MWKFTALLTVSLMLLTGCSQENTGYFPFNSVSRWIYSGKMVTGLGEDSIKYVVSSIGKKKIQGVELNVQRTPSGNEHYYSEDADGIYQVGYLKANTGEFVLSTNKRYVIRYPISTETSWEESLSTITLKSGGPRGIVIREEIPVKATIAATDDKIEVPAGIFRNCLRVEKNGEKLINEGQYQYVPQMLIKLKETSWYAPGIGLIKTSRIEETEHRLLGRGEWQLELTGIDSK